MTTRPEAPEASVAPASPGSRLLGDLAGLSPAYFGMVMATGIVSIAADLMRLRVVATVLFLLNIVVYCTLCVLTALRLIYHSRAFSRDLADHLRGPGFFTAAAGTSMLGSQSLMLADSYRAGMLLWGVALFLWLGLTYAIFAAFTIKDRKPLLSEGISGAWLLAVVATQSIAVLSALISGHLDQPYRLQMNFLALAMWLWGGMLYIWMMSLIFYRYTFFSFAPADLSPPYWINMGAMAISTLAGALLITNAHDAPFLLELLPFLKGFTILYWATGTWWIPMLVVLALWRYVYKRFPVKYDPLYWGAVFPLGMYAAGTHEMVRAMRFDFLEPVPAIFLCIACAAWLAAFAGFARDLLRRLRAAAS